MSAHGQAAGEQTDLLAVGQYSSETRSRGSVLHEGRECPKQLSSALKAGGVSIPKVCRKRGAGGPRKGSLKVALQCTGRSRCTVRGGTVSMGRGAACQCSCEE